MERPSPWISTGKVALEAAANDAATVKSELKIGDVMADGTVYAGISPDTNKAIFAAPANAPGNVQSFQKRKSTRSARRPRHKDFRLPTKGELNRLFNDRAAIERI